MRMRKMKKSAADFETNENVHEQYDQVNDRKDQARTNKTQKNRDNRSESFKQEN